MTFVIFKNNCFRSSFRLKIVVCQRVVGRPPKSTEIMGYQNQSFSSVPSGPFPPTLFPSLFPLFPLQALFTLPPLLPSSPPDSNGKLRFRYPSDLGTLWCPPEVGWRFLAPNTRQVFRCFQNFFLYRANGRGGFGSQTAADPLW